jgi:hypothetical protein
MFKRIPSLAITAFHVLTVGAASYVIGLGWSAMTLGDSDAWTGFELFSVLCLGVAVGLGVMALVAPRSTGKADLDHQPGRLRRSTH